jgi:enamine deaminase RidA (YjgF/YER057c/UK114 family)
MSAGPCPPGVSPEARLKQLGIVLPPAWIDKPNRVRALRSGIHVHMSGHGPIEPLTDTPVITGKLGRELNEAQGAVAARETGLYILGTLRGCIGSLDRVVRVVHAIGFINCAPGFNTPSLVLNGFSDLMVEIFGEIGRHTRSAIGVAELYRDIPVEIEALFEVRD